MAEFEINVQELEEGGKQFDFPLAPSWLDAHLDSPGIRAAADEGEVSVFASLSGGTDVVVHGHVRTCVIAECSRCTGDARIEVDTDLTALFSKRAKDARAAEVELSDEDLDDGPDYEAYVGDLVVLDELVREQVLLEVPMQPLCREDCTGIEVPEHVRGPAPATVDGKAVDPRLAPLMALRDGLGSGDTPKKSGASKKRGKND